MFALIGSAVTGVLMLVFARVLAFNAMPRSILLMDAAISVLLIGVTRFIHRDLHTGAAQPDISSPLEIIKAHWKQWLAEGSIYYGILTALLGAYMLWNRVFIGTFSPVSGQIKRWWGTFLVNFYGKYPQSILDFFGINAEKGSSAWMPVDGFFRQWADRLAFLDLDLDLRYMIVVVLVGSLLYLVLRTFKQKTLDVFGKTALLPLFVSCMLQIIYYNYTGYSAEKEWYWVGELIVIVIVVSLIVGLLSRLIPAGVGKNVFTWGLVALVGFSLSMDFWQMTRGSMQYDRWEPDTPFDDAVSLIEANTEPGSIVGMTGGGTTGYFIQDRTIVNMDGLINSKPYFESLQERTAGDYLQNMGLDYVYANRYILSSQPYKGMFDPYLTDTGVQYDGRDLMKFGK
jgi:hypothetical protein